MPLGYRWGRDTVGRHSGPTQWANTVNVYSATNKALQWKLSVDTSQQLHFVWHSYKLQTNIFLQQRKQGYAMHFLRMPIIHKHSALPRSAFVGQFHHTSMTNEWAYTMTAMMANGVLLRNRPNSWRICGHTVFRKHACGRRGHCLWPSLSNPKWVMSVCHVNNPLVRLKLILIRTKKLVLILVLGISVNPAWK